MQMQNGRWQKAHQERLWEEPIAHELMKVAIRSVDWIQKLPQVQQVNSRT